MVHRPSLDEKSCFVLLPLRQPFLGYFEEILRPAAAEMGLIVEKADDVYGTRPVISDIWDQIWRARIAIAIVTGKNPNVNYELGICHTLGIPTILLTEKEQDVPFDYRHRRYISYKPRNAGWEQKLREDIVHTIKAIFDEKDSGQDTLPWPYDIQKILKTSIVDSPVDDFSRQLVMKGVALATSVVSAAFGPDGVGISQQSQFGPPTLVRSGARILRSIRSGNPLQLQGIEAIRQLGVDMYQREGDLTKTAMLMASSMIEDGEKALRQGTPLKSLLSGMQQASEAAATYILSLAIPINATTTRNIAFTASRNEPIANLVAEASNKVGDDGLIEILEWNGDESQLEMQEGLQFDQGFFSPSFASEANNECILEETRILIFEPRIDSMAQLLPLLEAIAKSGESLLVISSDVTGEALATLVLNNAKGNIKCVAVRAPASGDRRRHMLEDIAVMTGGRAFLQEHGIPLTSVKYSDLGHALRASVSRTSTTIVGGSGNPSQIAGRVAMIRGEIAASGAAFDQAKLRERLAKLVSGIATIRIGGRTESEKTEHMYAATSALHACSTAKERGTVPGGGIALMRTRMFVRKMVVKDTSEGQGVQLVLNALLKPLRGLLTNAKVADLDDVLKAIVEADSESWGFDSETGKSVDLVQAGILDSARSLRAAIQLAAAHSKTHLSVGAWTQIDESPNQS